MPGRAGRPLGEFRGAAETGQHRWFAWDRDTAVGHIDCGTYDRWATWEGGPGGRGVTGTIDAPAGSISYVADPAPRRRGYGAAMVSAVLAMPELEHIELAATPSGAHQLAPPLSRAPQAGGDLPLVGQSVPAPPGRQQ